MMNELDEIIRINPNLSFLPGLLELIDKKTKAIVLEEAFHEELYKQCNLLGNAIGQHQGNSI